MELVGVSDITYDYRIRVAVERGYPIYASLPDKRKLMEEAQIPVVGNIDDLIRQVDVVVDCTPKGVGAKMKSVYEQAGVKAIWQGGEKHDLTGYSFTAQVNYAGAVNRQFTRVVSCNTTALNRLMWSVQQEGWVKRVRAVMLRRATDPWESHINGMINTAVPETKVPSHQGPDAQTVLPDLDITTMAGSGPYNLSHLHYAMIETTRPVSVDEFRSSLEGKPRICFIQGTDGLVAMNSVIELMRDLGRPRNDMWEVAVWRDALASDGRELYMVYQVHNEAIVVPENVDAIRALSGIETDPMKSIDKTDRSMGILRTTFLPATAPGISVPSMVNMAKRMAQEEFIEISFKGAEEPAEPSFTQDQLG
jgi:glyceraldehyde-3-phosphate dehydrogenase (NAD(P))